MADNIGNALFRQARAWGATDLHIEQGGKHPRLIGNYNGSVFTFIFPGSTGDRRAVLNCLSCLRRVIGVERETKPAPRSVKPRRRRAKSKARPLSTSVDHIERDERFYSVLAQIKFRMNSDSARKE
jgi:hypothetical protein